MTAQIPCLRLLIAIPRLRAALVILSLLLSTLPAIRASDRTLVPVAAYLNQPEVVEKEGKRTAAILAERKVTHFLGDRIFDEGAWAKWTATHGPGSAVIFVPRDESAEARVILARAIKAEKLRVTLKSDEGATITLDRILEPGKKP